MTDEIKMHPIQTVDGLKRLWKIGVETGRILQGAETGAATPKPPAGGDAGAIREAAMAMLPKNVCLTNPRWPDETVVPLETTLGELRALSAALALPAPVVEGEVDGVPKGMKRAYVRCRTHDRVAHYDYVPYSFSTAVAVMPCGCDTKHADRITHEQFVAATPVQTGGKPGWDEDGICNDHGRELCPDCARTPAALSEGRSHG